MRHLSHLLGVGIVYLLSGVTGAAISAPDVPLSRRSDRYPPSLEITSAALTSKWVEGSDYSQILEMQIENTHAANYLTLADTLNVTIESDSLDLVAPGTLVRLAPSQTAVVQVAVKNKAGVAAGTTCSATIVATYGQNYGTPITATRDVSGQCGFGDYSATASSLSFHWNPDWFHEVKFGIFIHWGVYAAPAYGNVGANEDYSEWYWYRQHQPNYRSQTYQYHLETYGESFNYDDFFSNFTDDGYDPKEWVDLFAEAGAQYIVPVTKHHDGFSLFNTSPTITQRSSMFYGPKRDLIGDLLAAAKTYHPDIRRGTYFSLPEWYNPAYIEYGGTYGGNYFGYSATNPYTNESIEYTGYVEVDDFIQDIQVAQMKELAYDYETEIMWCDIGGPNDSLTFMSEWLNWARDQGRQVTFNSRCGITGDFETPEYTTNAHTVTKKWETNRGMDPFSFGYNYQTPDEEYLTGEDVVKTLVDAVSKNGNFLLDVGPMHDGTIPAIMQNGLRDAGSWIHPHAESIFGTRFWSVTPGLDPFRYTTTPDAFYIHYLQKPSSTIAISDPVPWLPGDTVTVVGGSQDGATVTATKANGVLTLQLSDEIINGDKYVWTFKLDYTSDW